MTYSAKDCILEMFHRVLIMPLDYLSCFAKRETPENWYMPNIYLLQTKNFPLFWGHNIQAKEKTINHWIRYSLLYFFHSNVPDNKYNKQKWYVLFFTCIKIVVHMLSCSHQMKMTAIESQRERNALTCFNEKVQNNNVKMETF